MNFFAKEIGRLCVRFQTHSSGWSTQDRGRVRESKAQTGGLRAELPNRSSGL